MDANAARRPLRIAVIGRGAGATAESESIAECVGQIIGASGAVLITGGKAGVMEAASRGAHSVGGLTIGLLPDATDEHANPWVAIPIATGMGAARNAIVARSADAVIAIGGAYGTLSEIAFALGAGVPVIGLGTWGLTDGDGIPDAAIETCSGPEDAARRALELAASRRA